MKASSLLAVVLGSILCHQVAVAASQGSKRPNPEVVVSSDINSDQPETLRPQPDRPIYYYLAGRKEHTIGRAYAGEKMPDRSALDAEVVKALASQGYIRTQVGGPKPNIMLMIVYGTANVAIDEIRGEDGGDLTYNQPEMMQLIGAPKLNSSEVGNQIIADQVTQAIQEDRIYVMLGAFDAEALAKKQKKLLWRTRMSIESLRGDLSETLSVMLASGAPFFGRETTAPQLIDDIARRNPTVKIAPLEILGTEPSAPQGLLPKG